MQVEGEGEGRLCLDLEDLENARSAKKNLLKIILILQIEEIEWNTYTVSVWDTEGKRLLERKVKNAITFTKAIRYVDHTVIRGSKAKKKSLFHKVLHGLSKSLYYR